MLHVLNGDGPRPVFARAAIPGEVAVWGDMLSEGPVPGALRTEADWAARAAELEQRYDIPRAAYLANAHRQRAGLAEAAKHDEVVLWFEQDLFCLVNIACVLQRLGASPPRKVSLVFPEETLGSREAPALQRLFTQRTDALQFLDHGARLWDAYCDADPLPLGALAKATTDFPFWEQGIVAHLSRFPGARDGLSVGERVLLEVLDDGPLHFGEAFLRVRDDPRAQPLGMGDLQLASMARDLAAEPCALLALEDAGDARLDLGRVLSWQLERTPRGDAVRRGEGDALEGRGLDRWLGGVHLRGARGWRWDARTGRLVAPP